ncbi:hypothetical protein INR49_005200 [Caranx melampygus]|nr:hypothetical protein INR49_005200 [Caranx melampygus]
MVAEEEQGSIFLSGKRKIKTCFTARGNHEVWKQRSQKKKKKRSRKEGEKALNRGVFKATVCLAKLCIYIGFSLHALPTGFGPSMDCLAAGCRRSRCSALWPKKEERDGWQREMDGRVTDRVVYVDDRKTGERRGGKHQQLQQQGDWLKACWENYPLCSQCLHTLRDAKPCLQTTTPTSFSSS